MKSRISALAAVIMLIVLIVGVTIALVQGEWMNAMLVTVAVVLAALIAYMQIRIFGILSGLRQELRATTKTVSDIAGTVGRSAPLIRTLSTRDDTQLDALSVSDLAAGSSNAYREIEVTLNNIQERLASKEKMESQTLHQITGEARLMRMHFERVLFESEDD